MSEDNISISVKRILDAWRKGRAEYSNKDAQFLIELLATVKGELQLTDKSSIKRDILQWYLDIVKDVLEDYMMSRLLKSTMASIKKAEKMSQDINSLSWFLTAIPEEFDLTHVISHSSKSAKDKKTLAIVIREVEKFVGEDEKEYGPYPAGSLINIPRSIARILEEKKAIEEIFIT